jgi:hypothetical protein
VTGHEPATEGGAVPLGEPRAYDIIDERCTLPRCAEAASGLVYRMAGHCQNCGAKPLVGLFSAGHEHGYDGGPCPACGCRKIRWTELADSDPETAP